MARKRAPKKIQPPLTKKQDLFVDAMLDPDVPSATEAARRAGYSNRTGQVKVKAHELRRNPKIISRIEERKREVAKSANVTPAQILGATAQRAFASVDDAFDEDGNFDIKKARRTGAIHLIKKITKTKTSHGENIAVEFYSNESAQDKLGTYLGMERLPQHNPNTLEKVLGAYNLWCEKNPNATRLEKADAIEQFARGGGMLPEQLAEKVGVDLVTDSIQ